MSRYGYETLCEKRRDQIWGFWSFLFLNGIIFGFGYLGNSPLIEGAFPWIVNGGVLVVSLALRPHFAVGFLVSLAGLIAASLIYVASCLAACFVLGDSSPVIVCPALVFPAWLILAIVQSQKLYDKACRGEV